MKAIHCTAYGPPEVLRLVEVPKPAPKDDEILIRIRATSVTAADCEIRRFDFPGWIWLPLRLWFGLRRPRHPVLGQELAGDIEETGAKVQSFRHGDRVFAATGMALGAHAEWICLREQPEGGALAKIPANVSYEEAATVPYGGREALQFLRKGPVRRGDRVLINGAGGSFGTYAVQLARLLGAHVTAVDRGIKLDMLRSLGADEVVDYIQEDFTSNGRTYDLIFDVMGKSSLARGLGSLTPHGKFLLSNPRFGQLLRGLWGSVTSGKKVIFGAESGTNEDLAYLGGLIGSGQLRAVVDRVFPLEDMAEAHRYAESGLKQGNIVISVSNPDG